MQFEFWFEFGSTYSYPAVARVETLARSHGIDVSWQPFLLGPIFKAQGWADSPFNLYPSKGDYMWRDLERTCTRLGIPYKKPSVFPRNGLLAARVACSHRTASWVGEFILAIYTANFAHDRDISETATVEACLSALGVDATRAINTATTSGGKAELAEQTDHATAIGIFGAPTFVIGQELFWGNDRLEEAIDWYKAQQAGS